MMKTMSGAERVRVLACARACGLLSLSLLPTPASAPSFRSLPISLLSPPSQPSLSACPFHPLPSLFPLQSSPI